MEKRPEVYATGSLSDGKKYLLLAMLTSATVQSYLVWQYYCISSDGVRYIEAAREFYSGDILSGLGSLYPPGYSLMIAAAYPLVRDWELTGQLLSLAFGVGLLFPLFFLLRDVFDDRVAGIACLLASLSPFLARYAAHVRTESSYLFFLTLALMLLVQGIYKKRTSRFFQGGLVAGLAYLLRPEAIGLLIIIPGFLALRRFAQKERNWAVVGKYAALLIAGFSIFALPYIVYLSIDTGKWGAISRKAGITLAVNLGKAGVLETDGSGDNPGVASPEFFDLIRRHPLQYATKVVMDLPLAIGTYFEVMHFSYVPFLLIGLFLSVRGQFWHRREFILLSFVLFYLIGFSMILVRRRYSLQFVPVSLGWCAIGVLWVWEYCRESLNARTSKIILTSIGVFFLAATLPKTLSPISPEKAYVRDAGRYLGKLNGNGVLKIAVLDNRIHFYADAEAVYLFDVKESALRDHLEEQKARYLAVDTKSWRRHFPNASRRPENFGLFLDKEFVGTRNDRLLVFKVM
ncbi:MAG: glycosyltransferase family 39 protein [Deltaproteobacteria bacterium]|nr:glycosyltransferase family 39 protein [Deltaproteobacteria bacterium]